MTWGQLDIHVQNKEIWPLPPTYTQINSKWIGDLKVTMKLLKKKKKA